MIQHPQSRCVIWICVAINGARTQNKKDEQQWRKHPHRCCIFLCLPTEKTKLFTASEPKRELREFLIAPGSSGFDLSFYFFFIIFLRVIKKRSNQEKGWGTNFLVRDYGTHSSFLRKAGKHDLSTHPRIQSHRNILSFLDLDTVYIIHNYNLYTFILSITVTHQRD